MSTTATNLSTAAFRQSPFPTEDLLKYSSRFLTLTDAGRCSSTCKAWSVAMLCPDVWLTHFDCKRIPCIEGRERQAKEDLKFMLPRTYSAKQFACLGTFVGLVPKITANAFERFKSAKDAYAKNKTMSGAWVCMVEPTHFHRPYDKVLLDALIAYGEFQNEVIDSLEEKGLLIPNTPLNLRVLAGHPVNKNGEAVIFRAIVLDLFKKCSTAVTAVNVSLMRIDVPKRTFKLGYNEQKDLLQKNGHEIPPIRTRLCLNLSNILNHNTCSDKRERKWFFWRSSNYSRSSDFYGHNGALLPLTVGGFDPKRGMHVNCSSSLPRSYGGVAPYIPLEVVWPAVASRDDKSVYLKISS